MALADIFSLRSKIFNSLACVSIICRARFIWLYFILALLIMYSFYKRTYF